MKTLVVYFSRKGYVRRIAEQKASECGADILEITTSERTKGFLGFWWCGRFGMHRWKMPINPIGSDIASYDKVLICSPVWVFTLCAPVRTFVLENAGKIRAVDYCLLHFSNPMKYKKTRKWMDDTLGVSHGHFTSVRCICGHMKIKEFNNN